MITNVLISTEPDCYDELLGMLRDIGWQQEGDAIVSPRGNRFVAARDDHESSLSCQPGLPDPDFAQMVGELFAVAEGGGPDLMVCFGETDIDWMNREYTDAHYARWIEISEAGATLHEMREESWGYDYSGEAYERASDVLSSQGDQ